jgi:type II secretory pathway component PulJ
MKEQYASALTVIGWLVSLVLFSLLLLSSWGLFERQADHSAHHHYHENHSSPMHHLG